MRCFLFFWLGLQSIILSAQIPNGYYDSAQGLTGQNLRSALRDIIDGHTSVTYDNLWTRFQTTDKKANGKVWDMYSTKADGTFAYEFSYTSDQCGSYNSEADCYNREHSFPASWFDDDAPMYTDLFHLYPTDGYVNNRRSNYPFGEVGTATWTSTNGSKLGSSNYPGYSSTVFEPIDEFKGDFARSYFYMLTRYMSNISSFNSDMLLGSDFATWAKNMLLEWNTLDPVSQKEIDRNNAVYNIQHNRNPFIDHPEWAVSIWNPSAGINNMAGKKVQIWYQNQTLYWSTYQGVKSIEVYNVLGQKIKTIPVQAANSQYQFELIKGVYIANMIGDKRQTVKFVVK